jgi:hypothetical protein
MGDIVVKLFITKSDVPGYLQNSDFYCNGVAEMDEERFWVPSTWSNWENSLKPDAKFTTVREAKWLVTAFEYWGVFDVPADFINSFFALPRDDIAKAVCKLLLSYDHLPLLATLVKMYNTENRAERWTLGVRTGSLTLVQYLYEFYHQSHTPAEWLPDLQHGCLLAAAAGSLSCLQYLHEKGYACNVSAVSNCRYSDCLRYLCETVGLLAKLEPGWGEVYLAAGNFPCAKYAFEHGGVELDGACYRATVGGSVRSLRYFHEQGSALEFDSLRTAVARNHLECFKYALPHFDAAAYPTLLDFAACRDRVDIVKHLRECGCAWTESYLCAAIQGKSTACLSYALQTGYDVDEGSVIFAATRDELGPLMLLIPIVGHVDPSVVRAAAESGSLACLKYLFAQEGCPNPYKNVKEALESIEDQGCRKFFSKLFKRK